jgi:hypothetical protein
MAILHRDQSDQRRTRRSSARAAHFQASADRAGSIDPELAFEAAVALALSCGAIARAGEASREASRFTDSSYVLMGPDSATLKRIARADIVAELERQARIHGNLERYRLRFRPGRFTLMAALFAGFTALLSMQAWMNLINERRLAALEQSYLDHQASLAGGEAGADQAELAAIETVGEFERRLLRTQFEGCYGEVKANLARATDRLRNAHQNAGGEGAPSDLVDARGAYEEFKAAQRACRGSLLGLFSGWLPG